MGRLADAVRARQEIDLRIGACFTRFQTLSFRRVLGVEEGKVVSYGPCQFPTLGFVYERWKARNEFVPEKYWNVSCKAMIDDEYGGKQELNFLWKRNKVYDKTIALIIFENLADFLKTKKATVIKVTKKNRKRMRPYPLNTIELQKQLCRKLHMSSSRAMDICERLYNKGFISYPRTETNKYTNIDLKKLVKEQIVSQEWGDHAGKLADGTCWQEPRKGKSDDGAHPPIHPIKFPKKKEISGDAWRVYDFITRHFLACLSNDAEGKEAKLEIQIGTEVFTARGLQIISPGYLSVYSYETWNDVVMPSFEIGDEIRPEILLCESSTSPPRLLSESDLISLMDKTGIGTDATIHEHIKTIQERGYAHKEYNHFIPTQIGVYLIEAYKEIGVELYKPYLRAQMEKDLSTIAFGDKTKKEVVDASLKEMYRLFKRVEQNKERMKDALNTQLKKSYERERQIRAVETEIGKEKLEEIKKQAQDPVEEPVVIKEISNNIPQERKNSKYTIIGKCVRCKVNDLAIKTNTQTYELFLACQGFPKCKASQNISPAIKKCKLLEGTSCEQCEIQGRGAIPLFNIELKPEILQYEDVAFHCESFTTKSICVWPDCNDNLVQLDGILRVSGLAKFGKPGYDSGYKPNIGARYKNDSKWQSNGESNYRSYSNV